MASNRRRITLQVKLLGLAALLLAFASIIAVVGISSLGKVDRVAKEMYVDTTQPLAKLGLARANANENVAFLSNHILAPTDAELDAIEKAIAANDKLIAAELTAVKPTLRLAKGRAAFKALLTDLARYRSLRKDVFAVSRQSIGQSAADSAATLQRAGALNRRTAGPAFALVSKDFAQLFDAKVTLADAKATDVNSTYHSRRTLALVLLGLALALGMSAAFLVARGIRRGVQQVLTAAEGISGGDIEQHIDVSSRDEIGDMAAAMQLMIAYLKEMVLGAQRIAGGDLTVVVQPKSDRDTFGTAFAAMIASLRGLVGKVTTTAGELSAASEEMAATSDEAGRAVTEIATAVGEVAVGAERQVRVVESARNATEEVATAVQESAVNATETAKAVEETRTIAQQGVEAAAQATKAMESVRDSSQSVTDAIRELAAKSDQIGGIVATITGIAGQTNLLALNAAIEAARAGEQGRGFAVVAEEVRKLAEESQTAAGSISGLITAIQGETQNAVRVVEDGARRTEEGAATVEQTREAFERIGGSVDGMSARIGQIADAVQGIAANAERVQSEIGELAAVAEQSSASTEQVSASTEQTSASTEEIAASAQELARTAEELARLVGTFTLV